MDKTDEIRRINLEIALKFSKIGLQISEAKSIAGLFETLIGGVEKEFALPFVWITLIEDVCTESVIGAVKSSDLLRNRLSVVPQALLERLIPSGTEPVLANKDLQPYYKLFPSNQKYFIKSLALVPFRVGEKMAGSWNNADAVSDRYLPDMETDLLRKLAQKISLKLTELVADKK